ncbi:MAG: EAL domain-containing protein [Gallionella sp.]|nr:MAG: EAL domain-containing protein [Gallionella sp.]
MLEKPKILVVDDIRANLIAMRKLLGRLNCEVVEAGSGNEALAFCVDHDFALLLLDVDMPGMDGYEVARLLKEEPSTQQIPIIFVTATYEDQEHRLQGYQAGAVDYIQKPVDDLILLSKATIFLDLYTHRRMAQRELTRSEAMRIASAENEARFRQALTDAPIPIMLRAEDGEVVLLNRMWTELTGYTQHDIATVRDWLLKAYGRDQLEPMLRVVDQQFTQDGWTTLGEFSVRTADGANLIWDVRSGPLAPLPDGRRLAITMAVDVTERKRAEEDMRLATLVFQNSSEGMTVTDADGTIISVNPAFAVLTGYTAEEAVGKNPRILKSGRHDAAFYQNLWRDLNSSGHWQGEIWNRRKNGEIYAERLTINTIYNADGTPHRRVALFSDITQKKASEELIWQQANFDPLTGLPNRRMFHDRLSLEIKKARRSNLPLALLFLDLDQFKAVNDTLGHDMGDVLLKEATRRLLGCVRETDIVSRLGGDEFTVILTDLGEPNDHGNPALEGEKSRRDFYGHCVERVAKDILRKLAEPFLLGDKLAHVSASIGITFYPEDADTLDTLLKNADQAMYAAKNQGRNRYHYFTPAMQEAAQIRMRIANDLHVALAGNQFKLHYQPIVDMADGGICKAEALIRWQHPEHGLITPAAFIPIAEETGTIVDIGDWVFRQAAGQVARWRSRYCADFQVSINTSPVQYNSRESLHHDWLEHLLSLQLPGDSIVVEITEGLLLDASATINEKLLVFRDAGIQVAIDDFGTGYSSLAYLQRFDIDYLKIDQAFVGELAPGSKNMALCTAIIVMAHELGLKVIAEGIETQEQHELLAAAGCDYGQGFYYAKPAEAEVFEQILQKLHRH